jgi:hypothetical protein
VQGLRPTVEKRKACTGLRLAEGDTRGSKLTMEKWKEGDRRPLTGGREDDGACGSRPGGGDRHRRRVGQWAPTTEWWGDGRVGVVVGEGMTR